MRHDKLEKELRLMIALTENRRYTTRELADKFGFSLRMVYYYLESFRDWGFLVMRHGPYYSLDRRSPFFRHLFDAINFNEEEVLTLASLLNQVDRRNAVVERIREKLDKFYDFNILASVELRERVARNLDVLYEAIKQQRMVVIKGYQSAHSQTVSDRVVEPFMLINNNNDVRCYEVASGMNKTFKLSRMSEVDLLDAVWIYEGEHRQMFTDLFMFTGEEKRPVSLRLGLLSRNLLVEEYPAAEPLLLPDGDDHWRIDIDVVSYVGIGRFVLGLYDDIEVMGDDGFKSYLEEKIEGMYGGGRTPVNSR